MQNFIQSGKVLSLIAPAGGVKSGEFVIVGGLHGFAITDADEGAVVSVSREGVFSYAKAGEPIEAGAALYFDPVNKVFTIVVQEDAIRAVATEDAALEDDNVVLVLVPPLAAGGPGEGYEPDGTTIELDGSNHLHVIDSVFATAAQGDAADALAAIQGDQARRSSDTAQSCADATPTVIDLEDEDLAGDVAWAGTPDFHFTVPETGLYLCAIAGSFAANAGGTARRIALSDGSNDVCDDDTAPGADPVFLNDSNVTMLTAGTTLQFMATQDSGGALDLTEAHVAIQRIQ